MTSVKDTANFAKTQLNEANAGVRDELTVLQSFGEVRLTKLWQADGSIRGFDNALQYTVSTETVRDIDELSNLLTKLQDKPQCCIIRGRFVGDERAAKAAVKAKEDAAKKGKQLSLKPGAVLRRNSFFDDQALHTILIEVDKFQSEIDPIVYPERAIDAFVRSKLPEEFRGITYHWQLSSSAGHASKGRELRAHLWFFLRTPYDAAQLRTWATYNKLEIDISVFNAVQIHYTSRPVFEDGVTDPVRRRSGLLRGRKGDVVNLDLSKMLAQRAAEEAEAAAEAASKRAARAVRAAAVDGGASTFEAFNARHTVEDMLAACSYEEDGYGNWRSPNQKSGSYATRVFDGDEGQYWVSWSGSDADAGLGFQTKKGQRSGDAFDLFCHYQHGNDVAAALQAVSMELALEDFEKIDGDALDPPSGDPDAAATGDDGEAGDESRRQRQREENRTIGEGVPADVLPEHLTLNRMLDRFAFAHRGSFVVDLQNPRVSYALQDFKNLTAFSRIKVEKREVPVVNLWLQSPKRITVAGRTFRPGHEQFTDDPDGHKCVNTWKAVERSAPSAKSAENVAAFEEHVVFLFGAAAPRFLDWLAHIEQRPGELPHTAWLHISTETGTGRNWLAGVLSRVWRGHTAASFDLPGALATGFNAALSSKLLACVDELKEGGRDGTWRFSEALKSLITVERRPINEKYGRMWSEYNCCRFLLFSNHMTAIPIEDTDRRIEVAAREGKRQSAAYYRRLYSLLSDDRFIDDVAAWLAARDIARFNPGAHAEMSAVKMQMIDGQKTDAKRYAQALVERWPSDLITCEMLAQVIDPEGNLPRERGRMSALVRANAVENGIHPFSKRVKVWGKTTRLYTIRNHTKWQSASGVEIAKEVTRDIPWDESDWREFLDSIGAEGS